MRLPINAICCINIKLYFCFGHLIRTDNLGISSRFRGFDRIFTTNLIYQKPELLEREDYFSVHMDRYIAALIDTLNQGKTLEKLIRPAERIRQMIELYNR